MEWLLGTLRDKASGDYKPCVRAETVNDGDWHNSIIWKGEEQVCTMGIEVYEGKLNIVIYDGDEDAPCFIRKDDQDVWTCTKCGTEAKFRKV